MISSIIATNRYGFLCDGILNLTSCRLEVLELFERHCVQLCGTSEINRLRMIYETLRDNLGSSQQDGPLVAADLRNTAIRSLTRCLISLDIPQRDPRLLKFHIELLFRFLDPSVSPFDKTAATSQEVAIRQDRRLLAAECLQSLEIAYPTLLFQEASLFFELSSKELKDPTPGFARTKLAATVLSNLSSMYLKQQEAGSFASVDPTVDFELEAEMSSSVDEIVPQMAEDALHDPKFAYPCDIVDDSDDNDDVEDRRTSADALAPADTPSSSGKLETVPRPPRLKLDRVGLASTAHNATTSFGSSPRGIITQGGEPSVTSLGSKHSSRLSMPSGVAETDKAAGCVDRDEASTGSSNLRRSALTSALRTAASGGSGSNFNVPAGGDSGSIAWTAASSTPRFFPTEMPVMMQLQAPVRSSTAAPLLRRFSVPRHLETGLQEDEPNLIMTPEAQTALQGAAISLLGFMHRLDSSGVTLVARAMPALLRAARPPPMQLWPIFERHLRAGSLSLVRAVLNIHDEMPGLFEGRGPCLVEKVLTQANDPSLSPDHRSAAVSWVMRQHAAQCHAGGELYLVDCWEQLLPRDGEPGQLAALKVKALAACLSSGIGDEEQVCKVICSWEGFGGLRPSEHQLRSLTYALRTLLGAAPKDGPSAHRLGACLVTSILEGIIARPQLVPAVDSFLETCPPEFASVFLRALDALLCSVEGQFEVLRERPEDKVFDLSSADKWTRVKAAMLSRSSSLSGLMRGLSFKLSFTKRTHSVLPSAGAGEGPRRQVPVAVPTPERPLDVRTLRSSISTALQKQEQQHQAMFTPRGRGAAAPVSTMNGVHQGHDATFSDANLRTSVAGSTGKQSGSAELSSSLPAAASGAVPAVYVAPPVPMDLPSADAVEAWLTAPATWEGLANGLLHQDLIWYRPLMKRVLNCLELHPRGTLRTMATYTWQYKEPHPTHALPAKETAAALLGLCHTAALSHLPCLGADGWTMRQTETADAVLSVLDALEEGFPVPAARSRCRVLANLVSDEVAWTNSAKGSTLSALLCGYVDAAVEG